MRVSAWLACLAMAGTATAVQVNHNQYQKRQGFSRAPPLPDVPSYNFTMPVDHFTASDTRTYSNRYYINDTYYKPGGPVIFYDNGEAGLDKAVAAISLAEYNGSVSATMRLAAKLNGLVIGWEHRYYGYSQPFDVNEKTGVPVSGAAGYKYLTIEQALEDIVYFANRFNTSSLEQNSNVQSTANLDPYHTPWIFMGGSYPGARAAWIRQRNPEIFYAAWASSATVQVMTDGTTYWNPVSRSLPSNCTKDLQAISAYVDQVLTSSNTNAIRGLKAGAFLMQPANSQYDITAAYTLDPVTITNVMLNGITGNGFQGLGPGQTTQIFCDYLQTFDVDAYLTARKQMSTNADQYDVTYLALQNRGRAAPQSAGIVASNGNSGPELGFIAFTWAFYAYQTYQARIADANRRNVLPITNPRQNVDTNSWIWQTLVQTGWFQGTKPGVQFFTSKYLTVDTIKGFGLIRFPSFQKSDFPAQPNITYPDSFGGWNMKPSNTMFTSGEFDPWRAFGVHSQEPGAPNRKATATVPKCNTPPDGSDVFGIVYPGAVHTEDLYIPTSYRRASEETPKPLYQGLDLFTKAYAQWQICFNQSRDDIRNNRGVDGQGNSANGTSTSSSSSGSASRNAANRPGLHRYTVWSVLVLALKSLLFISS